MANLLPSDLTASTTIANGDILLVQKVGESEVKKIAFSDLIALSVRNMNKSSALVPGTNVPVDLSASQNYTLSPVQDFTLDFPTNVLGGETGYITITQDATGSRLLTLASGYKTVGGTPITLTTTANAVDVIEYKAITPTSIVLSLMADVK